MLKQGMVYDVITLGSNAVDVFVHTDQSEVIDIRTKHNVKEFISYPVGSKMLITKLIHNIGGNGVNTAVAFSRLGLRSAYLGKIGKDHNGKLIMDSLKKERIDFIGSRGEEAGFSIILDSIGHDRTILAYKGCNNNLRFNEINKSKLKTKWLYLSSMLGESLHTMQMTAKHARENRIKVAFNPSATILEKHTKAAIDLLRFSDVLILNKEEAESLVGESTVEVNIKKLLVYGPSIIVVTDGKNGVTAFKDKYFHHMPADKHITVVESTGAGDAFASTFVAGLIMNKPFDYCLRMGVNNAESVIQHHGAQNLLLNKKKLFETVKQDKRKIEKRKA